MKIFLSPANSSTELVASVAADVLTVNGVELDFSALQAGEVLPTGAVSCEWIIGPVQRIDGEIHLTIKLPHGANAPQETRFPAALHEAMTVTEGLVPLPPYAAEEETL